MTYPLHHQLFTVGALHFRAWKEQKNKKNNRLKVPSHTLFNIVSVSPRLTPHSRRPSGPGRHHPDSRIHWWFDLFILIMAARKSSA